MWSRRLLSAMFIVAAVGCGDDVMSPIGSSTSAAGHAGVAGVASLNAGSSGSSAGTSASTSAATTMKDDGAATFTSLYTFVFRSCRVMNCHGTGIAGVNMISKDDAWNSLVSQPASPLNMCVALGKQRVVPGKPDESLLYLKLDIHAPCGQQMPPGGQLSQKFRDRVRDWIANGALND